MIESKSLKKFRHLESYGYWHPKTKLVLLSPWLYAKLANLDAEKVFRRCAREWKEDLVVVVRTKKNSITFANYIPDTLADKFLVSDNPNLNFVIQARGIKNYFCLDGAFPRDMTFLDLPDEKIEYYQQKTTFSIKHDYRITGMMGNDLYKIDEHVYTNLTTTIGTIVRAIAASNTDKITIEIEREND